MIAQLEHPGCGNSWLRGACDFRYIYIYIIMYDCGVVFIVVCILLWATPLGEKGCGVATTTFLLFITYAVFWLHGTRALRAAA